MGSRDLPDMSALALGLVRTYQANHSCPCYIYNMCVEPTTMPYAANPLFPCGLNIDNYVAIYAINKKAMINFLTIKALPLVKNRNILFMLLFVYVNRCTRLTSLSNYVHIAS